MSILQAVKKLPVLVTILFIVCAAGCKKDNGNVYYNLGFGEISATASAQRKAFCIVLAGGGCPPCEWYINRLDDDKSHLTKKALFNIVNTDLPEHRWYRYWTCLSASPATLIFAPSGNLIAIVNSANQNSFDCIERSVGGNTDCAAYTYNPPFARASHNRVMQTLNMVLSCKNRLDAGENIGNEIRRAVAAMPYPYAVWLQALDAQKHGDPGQAARYAAQMLSYRDGHKLYRRLYAGLFTEAKYIAGSAYDPSGETVLVADSVVRLDNCMKGVPLPFAVTVSNPGTSDIIIDDILTSCDCLTLESAKWMQLKAGESASLEFVFTGDVRGLVHREVTIWSNAGQNPVKTVEINALVN